MPQSHFEFSENDVLMALEQAGLEFKNGSRYILTQCPTHEDKHPSAQIYKDDWFVNCQAGCGRYPIQKAFPQLGAKSEFSSSQPGTRTPIQKKRSYKQMTEHQYKQFDLTAEWLQMHQFLDGEFSIHGVPAEVLNDMGWRWTDFNHTSVFIPYFSASKQTIPFAQYRHLEGDRRFTMLKDAKPTCYGTWNLDNPMIFVVEGTSDCAVLEYAAVPWIGLPSAASKTLMQSLCHYAVENGIQLVYAGDNDLAGKQLLDVIDEIMPYRVKQPPKEYKDWGEFLEAKGLETVQEYCFQELFPSGTIIDEAVELDDDTLAAIRKVW